MFNRARFNLSTFNHVVPTSDIILRANYITTAAAMIANGENVGGIVYMYNNAYGQMYGSSGVRLAAEMAESAEQNVSFGAVVFVAPTPSEACAALLKLSENIHITDAPAVELLDAVHIGMDIHFNIAIVEAAQVHAALGEDIITSLYSSSVLDGQISTAKFNIKYTTLNVTIPPGGVLVIDSDNFNMYLDGQDVIAKHSGAWVSVNRDTRDILIENPLNANLITNIMFTEKFI